MGELNNKGSFELLPSISSGRIKRALYSMNIIALMKELYISDSPFTSGDLRKLSVNFGGRVVKLPKAIRRPKTWQHGGKLSRAILTISMIFQSLVGSMTRNRRHCSAINPFVLRRRSTGHAFCWGDGRKEAEKSKETDKAIIQSGHQ